jgi:hypothetical protein
MNIEERERLFVYEVWPVLPAKVQQSILRKAKAFAPSTFSDVFPSAPEKSTNDGSKRKAVK